MRVNFYIGQYAVAEHLVSTFFRFVVDITQDRDTIVSTQPREPVLAFVSSRLLSDPETRFEVFRSWESSLAGGVVNSGDVGEQIAVLFLLFTFDDVANPLERLPGPVPLSSFWESLFGEKRKVPLGLDGGILKTIFFNHVVRVSSSPTQRVVEEAYCRGAALLLPGQFPGTDVLIPMRTETGDIGAILVQIKNRRSDKLTSSLKVSFKHDMKAAIEGLQLAHHLPGGYLGLVLCLRRKAGPEYEVLSARMHSKNQTITFRIVCALGLDVYRWRTGWPNGDQVAELFDRVLQSWPNMYPEAVLNEEYARKLIYPFAAIN
jgi:hypothetical protein